MKSTLKYACLLIGFSVLPFCVLANVESTKYAWEAPSQADDRHQLSNVIFSGESTLLDLIELRSVVASPSDNGAGEPTVSDRETLIIVKSGSVSITLNGIRKSIGPGSIALIMPNDPYQLKADEMKSATFFELSYKSKEPVNLERGRSEGGSFVVDFENLEFKPHDKGGLRSYYDRATAMTHNFEMHVTTLNEGITSHPQHVHKAEEIILMIKGEAEELIDDKPHSLSVGDLVFLDSEIPHGIRNTGKGACMYFAFQWR